MVEKKGGFIQYNGLKFSENEVIERSKTFYNLMDKRRSVRNFSSKDVPKVVIDHLILTASSAPSGAHKQPWTFCAIRNTDLKKAIRLRAETEERINYDGRMSERWLEDLAHLGTDAVKEHIEDAPWIIVMFKKTYNQDQNGEKTNNYYVNESVGIAAGFLIAAIHQAGLCTLTHTPSPMNFMAEVLKRPKNEKAFLLLPVGYPVEKCSVPDLERKKLEEVAIYFE